MRIASLALLLPLAACGGGTDESVSGVFPSSAFLGRQVRVEISGDTTGWKPGASVNFGAGVTVQNVAVASPTALFADITVMPDAAPGLRDVTVEQGGSTLVLKEAFQLESAISLTFKGTVAQGSIATFAINNHDFDTPFDTTSTGDGLFTPITYVGTTIEGPAGITFQIDSMTPYGITGLAFFDVDAAAGPLSVVSGVEEAAQIKSSLGVDLDVKARAPMALTANQAVSGNVEAEWASQLYTFTPSGSPALASFTATASSSSANPGLALLGPSGTFDEMISYAEAKTLVQLQAFKVYAIFVDAGGGYGYSYNVKANSQTMTTLAENDTANNTAAGAPMLTTAPTLITNATLASDTDADWYAITVTAADVGKTLRAMTTGTDPQTDTVLQFFKANGTAAEAFGAPSDDNGFHEDWTSAPIPAAGKYWVKVTASSYFDDAHNAYVAAVWLE